MKTNGAKYFPSSPKPPHGLCGPLIFLSLAKRQGQEGAHSRPSSTEVKNEWSHTATPPLCLHGVGPAQTGVYDT